MRVFVLSSFVAPGGVLAGEGEVIDLPSHLAVEAISLGTAAEWTDPVPPPPPPPEPKPKPKKGGDA